MKKKYVNAIKFKPIVFTSKNIRKLLEEKKSTQQKNKTKNKPKNSIGCNLINKKIVVVFSGLPRVNENAISHIKTNIIDNLEKQGATVYVCCVFWNFIGGRVRWKFKNNLRGKEIFISDIVNAKKIIINIHKKERTFIKYIEPYLF